MLIVCSALLLPAQEGRHAALVHLNGGGLGRGLLLGRGLGLGLSLCKSIVTAHGGKIEAVDNHPRGTIFRFTLRASEVTPYE